MALWKQKRQPKEWLIWQNTISAAVIALIQLYLLRVNSNNELNDFWLIISTALLFSAAIFLVPPETYLPVFTSAKKFKRENESWFSVRISYALIGFSGYIGGSLYQYILPWAIKSIISLLSSVTSQSHNLFEIQDKFIDFLRGDTLTLFASTILWIAISTGVESLTLKYGARAQLHKNFHQSEFKSLLLIDEQLFKKVAFFSGLTISFGLNVIILLLIGLGFKRILGPGDLIKRDDNAQPELIRTQRIIIIDTFYLSAIFIPLAQKTTEIGLIFLILLWLPSLICIIIVQPWLINLYRVKLWVIRGVTMISYGTAACLQLLHSEANPFILFTSIYIPSSMNWPTELNWMIQVLIAVTLAHLVLRTWWSPDPSLESKPDPFLSLLAYKIDNFVTSLSFRLAMLALFISTFPLDEKKIGVFILGLVTYTAALILPIAIQPKRQIANREMKELREHFSSNHVRKSLATNSARLRQFFLWRDTFNLIYILFIGVLALLQQHPVLRIASIPTVLVTLSAYCAGLVDEVILSLHYFGFERRIAVLDRLARWTIKSGWAP